jgi:hypothetical protein
MKIFFLSQRHVGLDRTPTDLLENLSKCHVSTTHLNATPAFA